MQTEEERIRYDRQVRLWGASTQQQISNTNVKVILAPEACFVGSGPAGALSAAPSGLAGEVSKNLVLAGVKSIALSDFTPPIHGAEPVNSTQSKVSYCPSLRPDELSTNFYSRVGGGLNSLGSTRSFAMANMMQDLNPFVKVLVSSVGLSDVEGQSKGAGNSVLFETINLLELATFALSEEKLSGGSSPSVAPVTASSSSSRSVWGVMSLGPYAVVLERTTAANNEAQVFGGTVGINTDRCDIRKRLVQLFSKDSARCAALTTPARILGLTFVLVKLCLAEWPAASMPMFGSSTQIARSDLVLAAHGEAIDSWGLALNEETAELISTSVGLAIEVLECAGFRFAAEVEDESSGGGSGVFSASIVPTIVDTSVVGGLVAQRVINAVSSSSTPTQQQQSGAAAIIENIYAFCSSGPSVEAYVSGWPPTANK